MESIKYKVETFGCTLSTMKKFKEKLQVLLDQYGSEGWKLHSYQVILGDVCVVVFCREC